MIWTPRRGWIGIDLGTDTVKVAQVARHGRFHALRQTVVIPRESTWPLDDLATAAPRSSAGELATALSLGSDLLGSQAACSLPMALYDLHGCQLAPSDERPARAAMLASLRETLADRLRDREFDYWETDTPGEPSRGGGSLAVLSVAQSWARQVALDCRVAGLATRVLDGLPWALCRAAQLVSGTQPDQVTAIVDWGAAQSTLCLVGHGRPLFVRSLRDCGYQPLVQTVAQALEIPRDDAFRILHQEGIPPSGERPDNDVQQLLGELSAEILCHFCDELHRTLSFAQSHRRLTPSQLIVFGGGATLRNGAPYLAERTGLPVTPWRPAFLDERSPLDRAPIELFGPAIALSLLAWGPA